MLFAQHWFYDESPVPTRGHPARREWEAHMKKTFSSLLASGGGENVVRGGKRAKRKKKSRGDGQK